MKVKRILIVTNVLVCFLLNNLLFTYSTEQVSVKQSANLSTACASEGDCCSAGTEGDDACCQKENCCANIPSNSSHINFSVIIGIDKSNDATLYAASLTTFSLSNLKTASELSDGYLNSLIRPPAFS